MGTDVVLGLGGCLDYEIRWDARTLAALAASHDLTTAEVSPEVGITSERELVRSILGFVREGAGGERYVTSSRILRDFADRFARRTTLGGTNVRAALAMSRLGVPSTLHLVSIDDQFRSGLPAGVGYVCSATRDTVDPHLIVQYPAGARIRTDELDITAPRENRLIYVHDPPNREMRLSPELGPLLASARIVLLSGLNSMQDPQLLRDRLRELRERLRSLPEGAVVVYEEASFHRPGLAAEVRHALAGRIDVHGMNEDEMQALVGRRVNLLDASDVAAALADLRAAISAPVLVVHTAHWALVFGRESARYRRALEGGIALASARYLRGDELTSDDHARALRLPRQPRGASLAAELSELLGDEVCCVPGLVLDTPSPTTIGLGDSFVGGFIAALKGTPS